MKLLKLTLDDGKNYTFQTFSVMEQRVMKKTYEAYQDKEDSSLKIQFEVDENDKLKKDSSGNIVPRLDLSIDERKKLREIEDTMADFSVDIVRKSLCKNHKEFVKTNDEEKDKDINEQIMSLMDGPTLKKLVAFSFVGTYQPDDEEIMDYTVTIKKS